MLEQLLPGEHPAGLRRPWQARIWNSPGVHVDRLSVAGTSCRTGSTSSAPTRQHRVAPRTGSAVAAQQGADPGDQFTRAVRLGHVVVGAQVEAEQQVVLGGPGGQHEHRHVRTPARSTRQTSRPSTFGIITSSTSRPAALAGLLERGPPVVHHDDLVALALQIPADQLRLLLVVLGDQHVRTHGGDCTWPRGSSTAAELGLPDDDRFLTGL